MGMCPYWSRAHIPTLPAMSPATPRPRSIQKAFLFIGSLLFQIVDGGLGAQFFLQPRDPGRRDKLGNETLGVRAVTEECRPAHAGGHAGGKHPDGESVETEVALPGVADGGPVTALRPLLSVLRCGTGLVGLGRGFPADHFPLQLRRLVRIPLPEIGCARSVGAGRKAVTASDAAGIVYDDDPLVIAVGRCDRTDCYAGRVLALHAGTGQEAATDIGVLPDFLLDNGSVHDPGRELVFGHAPYGTGMASDAPGDVDDHAPLDLRRFLRQGPL